MSELWVFGYGSILWNPGFACDDQLVGYVEGYVRRFWQGNTTHRGTPRSPGRVATLVKQSEGRTWGIAYHLLGSSQIKSALDHLGLRECILGGYVCQIVSFTRRPSSHSTTNGTSDEIPALTFIASPSNSLYLGPVDLDDLARQVAACCGNSGTNTEYVIRLADFVHANIPEDDDSHLFLLEKKIRKRLELTTETGSNPTSLQEEESLDNNSKSVLSIDNSQTGFDVRETIEDVLEMMTMNSPNDRILDALKILSEMLERNRSNDDMLFSPSSKGDFTERCNSLQAENIAMSARRMSIAF